MMFLIFFLSHRHLCQSKQIGHLVCCVMEQKLVRMWGRTLTVWKPLIHTEDTQPLWHWSKQSICSVCCGLKSQSKGQIWTKDLNYVYDLKTYVEYYANKPVDWFMIIKFNLYMLRVGSLSVMLSFAHINLVRLSEIWKYISSFSHWFRPFSETRWVEGLSNPQVG